MDPIIKRLNEKSQEYSELMDSIEQEISKVIVGQTHIIKRLLICLVSDGHFLLEGVPGLAKTMLIRTLSQVVNGSFNRIQFTPDLLPADIVGTKIYNHETVSFTTKKGPVFANFILADEINRAPPKVQSALLESMQERQVTISGDTFDLDKPFLVMATQNPIETEGTYKLPEAQVDRFMMKVLIDYPSMDEEKIIMSRMTEKTDLSVNKILTCNKIIEIQQFCRDIYVDDKIKDYVASIIDITRNPESYGMKITELIDYGASPRASIWLIMASKANAMMDGRGYVIPEDIIEMAYDVLRHRIILSYEAEAEGITVDKIIADMLKTVKVP
ncbi:MoxR family ATPase [Candidatus Woesearchaeota archaeon]|nr:MoxR family ATPase [Candidatus Woesearchaeota archaeon]